MPDQNSHNPDFDRMLAAIETFGEGARFTKEELKATFMSLPFEERFIGFLQLDLIRKDPNQKDKFFMREGYWDDLIIEKKHKRKH